MITAPPIAEIETVARLIEPYVVRTPTVQYTGRLATGLVNADVFIKLELLQYTGSFKPRGALNTLFNLDDASRGVTAFSAGNHAIAVAYAATQAGVSAKVVMPSSANPFRIERCRALGAQIEFGEDVNSLLAIVDRIQVEEGRAIIHPFEGIHTVGGTATVGLELCSDIADLDAVIVPVGGGGLLAGVASAVKQLQPQCRIIGVEPEGACGMSISLQQGEPLAKVNVDTIADSLGAPLHLPYTFSLIQQYVDDMVLVSDDQIRQAMRQLFTGMKLAVEPACAAGFAALQHPLCETLRGKRVALVACGSNIDLQTYQKIVQ